MNQRRLQMYRDDELLFEDEWIPEDDAVPNAEELRQCFRRWWRLPAKTALVLLLLLWWFDQELEYSAQQGGPAMVVGSHNRPPPKFVSPATRSPAVLPTVREGGKNVTSVGSVTKCAVRDSQGGTTHGGFF